MIFLSPKIPACASDVQNRVTFSGQVKNIGLPLS